MLKRDADQLHRDIANLYLQFPELKDDDEMLRVDTLEGATNLKEMMTAILHGIADAQALRDGTKPRIEELQARQKRFGMRIDFLRAMIVKTLNYVDVRKLELPEATLSIKSGTQQVVGDIDPLMLPDDLCRISREPDKAKIKTALLNGEVVPGYMLSNGEPSLAVYSR